jgi:Bacterial Ig-like domain (group 3)
MRTRLFGHRRFARATSWVAVLGLVIAGAFVVTAPSAGAAGTRAFTADFGITDNVFADPSGPITVGQAIPVNIVIIDNDPSCVFPTFTSCITPTGTVTIFARDAASTVTTLGSATLSPTPAQLGRSGQAVFAFPETLPAGDYTVYGTYSGDSTFAASTSDIGFVVLTIDKATPTVSLTQAASSSPIGAPITFHAAVTFPNTATAGNPPQPASPTGTITLLSSGGTTLGTESPDANGDATFSLSAPTATSVMTVHAAYSGDANLLSASSSNLVHNVVALESTTTLTATPTSATAGSAVTLHAHVTPQTATAGEPTGNVAFRDGGGLIGNAPVDASGDASLTTTALPAGTRTITAVYAGDATVAGSTSSPITVTISAAAAAATQPSSTSAASGLAATGADDSALVELGLGLLLVGAGVLMVTGGRRYALHRR